MAENDSTVEEIIKVRKKRKTKSKTKKIILIIAIVILGILAATGIAIALYVNSLSEAIKIDDPEVSDNLKQVLTPVEADSDAYYTLILGSDAREGDVTSRSDVIILMRVDPENAQLTMVSIPRDTRVEIEGYGMQKINAAYAIGGASASVDAVSKFANVPITHYAEIHFEELKKLVDLLGGVWIDVPVANDETGESNTGFEFEPGEQLLDGENALAFAREREGYERGDFQRSDSQRLLLNAIMKKVLSASPIDLPGVVQQAAQCASSDYTINDLIDLALKFQSSEDITVYSCMAPSSLATIDDLVFAISDEPKWKAMMERVDAGKNPIQ